MQTFYTIKLSAKVFRDTIDYTAFWNGSDFERRPRNKWCSINDEQNAQTEFNRIITTIKPDNWNGRYKINLIAETYDNDNLQSQSVLKSFQTTIF